MRSLRLDEKLDARARRAAAMEGSTLSEFMRRAIAERAERMLAGDPEEQLADIIGAVHSAGAGQARDTGGAFTDLLTERRARP